MESFGIFRNDSFGHRFDTVSHPEMSLLMSPILLIVTMGMLAQSVIGTFYQRKLLLKAVTIEHFLNGSRLDLSVNETKSRFSGPVIRAGD